MTATRAARGPLSGMLRGVVLAGCVGSLVVATVAWATKGERAGSSALAGAFTAFAVMLLGVLAMTALIHGEPRLSLAAAFVVYVGQLVLLVGVLLALRGQEWLDGPAFTLGAIVETVLLQAGQIVGYTRARHEIFPQGEAR